MKRLFLLIVVLAMHSSYAHQIPVGYYSKYAKIWRFYERNRDNSFDPKVIVYNITDKPIIVCMKIVTGDDKKFDDYIFKMLKQFTGLSSDTVIAPVTIPAKGYGIYSTEQLLTDKSAGFFDAFYINGERAGIEPIRPKLEHGDTKCKYFSWEGLSGAFCLFGTNDLMIKEGKKGRMTLYFNNLYPERRYSLQHSSWKFDMELYKGIANWTVTDPEGKKTTVDASNRKNSFTVDFTARDSFQLEMTYRVYLTNDSLPQLELRRNFGNGSNGVAMPVLLKRD